MKSGSTSLAQRKREVPEDFDLVAATYDRLVRRNPGYVEHLRLSAQRLALPDAGKGARLLDLCCGTGLSTDALARTCPDAEIVGLDASAGMLDHARTKPTRDNISFVLGDASDPAASIGNEPFDAILMAYGIRNLADPDAALERILALLNPGAPVCFHEYSVRGNPRAMATWTGVAWGIIIPNGLITAHHTRIFRYLWRSVLDFDSTSAFEERLRGRGFVDVHTLPMTGWQRGICHSFLARRPVVASPPRSASSVTLPR